MVFTVIFGVDRSMNSDKITNTLSDWLGDLRIFFYGGMRSLPFTIAGTMLIMSLFTANFAMLFFLVGYLIIVPLVVMAGNIISNKAAKGDANTSFFRFPLNDVCGLSIPYLKEKSNVFNSSVKVEANVFSPWLSMVVFFITYMLTNAFYLLNREPIANALNITKDQDAMTNEMETKYNSRLSQAIISIVFILVFALYVLFTRLYNDGCETKLTAIMTILVFGGGGYGWYHALSGIGQDRLSDLFGIANRLLTPAAISNQPIACVPMSN